MKRKSKYSVLAAALLAATCLCGPAFAGSNAASTSNAGSISTSNGTGIANAGNSAANSASNSNSGSVATGLGTGGAATGSGTSTSSVTFNDPAEPATQRIVTTGAAIAPSIYSNNVCALSASAAGGFLGGAFALGFDRVDKGCDIRANAALLGHFLEVYSATATHAVDPVIRQAAEQAAMGYAQWAANYICMANPDLAAAAPPGSNFCHTVATQQGLEVVPAPVAYTPPPPPPVVPDLPKRQLLAGPPAPHVYGPHEVVPSSHHTGPISGYNGPDYVDD